MDYNKANEVTKLIKNGVDDVEAIKSVYGEISESEMNEIADFCHTCIKYDAEWADECAWNSVEA